MRYGRADKATPPTLSQPCVHLLPACYGYLLMYVAAAQCCLELYFKLALAPDPALRWLVECLRPSSLQKMWQNQPQSWFHARSRCPAIHLAFRYHTGAATFTASSVYKFSRWSLRGFDQIAPVQTGGDFSSYSRTTCSSQMSWCRIQQQTRRY